MQDNPDNRIDRREWLRLSAGMMLALGVWPGVARWSSRTESPFMGPATPPGGIAFAHNEDRIVAVNMATGQSAWPSSDVSGPPAGFELANGLA